MLVNIYADICGLMLIYSWSIFQFLAACLCFLIVYKLYVSLIHPDVSKYGVNLSCFARDLELVGNVPEIFGIQPTAVGTSAKRSLFAAYRCHCCRWCHWKLLFRLRLLEPLNNSCYGCACCCQVLCTQHLRMPIGACSWYWIILGCPLAKGPAVRPLVKNLPVQLGQWWEVRRRWRFCGSFASNW